MRIIAFVTEAPSVQRILDHIGEPTTPPRISPCRGPPECEQAVEPVLLDDVVQPEHDYQFDQTVSLLHTAPLIGRSGGGYWRTRPGRRVSLS